MEHTYNNAVVHAFVRLMVDALKEKKKRKSHFWGVPLDQDNSDEIEEQLESGKLLYILAHWEMYDCDYNFATSFSLSAYTTTS